MVEDEDAEEEWTAVAEEETGGAKRGAPILERGVEPEMMFSVGGDAAAGAAQAGGGGGGGGGATVEMFRAEGEKSRIKLKVNKE